MDVIQKTVDALPPPAKSKAARLRQYEDAKQQIARLPATFGEYEKLCKAIAQRYLF